VSNSVVVEQKQA